MLKIPIISCCLCYLQSMIIATILQLARVIPRAACLVVDQSDRGIGVSYSCSELRLYCSLVLLDIETSELWTACVQKYRR